MKRKMAIAEACGTTLDDDEADEEEDEEADGEEDDGSAGARRAMSR